MLKYSISNQVVADLEDIWDYTCNVWSETQAEKYYRTIISGFDAICSNPLYISRDYSSIMDGLRGYKINKHIIFYFIKSDSIHIVRILHETMDLARHLKY